MNSNYGEVDFTFQPFAVYKLSTSYVHASIRSITFSCMLLLAPMVIPFCVIKKMLIILKIIEKNIGSIVYDN